jgi:hypothetical protein
MEQPEDEEEPKEDHDIMQEEFVLGMLKTGLLARLRYLMEVMTLPEENLEDVCTAPLPCSPV